MATAKLEITLGSLTFVAEGEQEWLADQLDKVLGAAPSLGEALPFEAMPDSEDSSQPRQYRATLASHIRAKGGESNQVQRFLASADWLRLRGETKLTTRKVTKALRENQQKRLSNPADCLNKNVSKGFCEKGGEGFFITPEGLNALGQA